MRIALTVDQLEDQLEQPEAPAAKMPVTQMVEVEVKRWHGEKDSRVFGWQRMPVKEALRLQEDAFRCPECLGRVRLRAANIEKDTTEHAEHYSKNTGCSLGNCFSGEKQLHPKPLN